ncbi:uncharacterized protein LOC128984968 [Macrosteles quadrilineatus]|uniref:uncharacterized protein LOC128984968 n=1 Tax=Macrosteles quadrilineatus TaxID=74068 RepID=UPI0023E10583|nr:uncharacterized protein LOC128984968 [Macrosteles quadrilineatus]
MSKRLRLDACDEAVPGPSWPETVPSQPLTQGPSSAELPTDSRHQKVEPQRFKCASCKKAFASRSNLTRHMKDHDSSTSVSCEHCAATFTRKSKLIEHINFSCPAMKERNAAQSTTSQLPTTSNGGDDDVAGFRVTESAFQSRLRTYELKKSLYSSKFTMQLFLTFIFEHLVTLLARILEMYDSVKINVFMECEFENVKGETCLRNFKTVFTPLLQATDIEQFCSNMFAKLIHEKEELVMKGSGWAFLRVTKFEVRVNRYVPLRGGSGYIPLPKRFKGVVNTRNLDDRCFFFAILAKFVTSRDARDPNNYPRELADKYNWQCIDFPVKLKDIHIFEKVNNISINVFGLDKDGAVYPLKVCDAPLEDHRDLLLLTNKDQKSHYVYIKDFNSLVHSQLTKDCRQIFSCKKCFAFFQDTNNKLGISPQERLIEHERYCSFKSPLRLDLSEDPTISFQHPERSQKQRFVIYADFETYMQPNDPLSDNPITHNHVPYSYCYLIKDSQEVFTEIRRYRGPDAAKEFVKSVRQDALRIGDILYGDRHMTPQLSPDQERAFQAATTCHICGKAFSDSDKKVRDHMHSTPYTYRGAAHNSCNLKFHEQNTINVYFHNLSGYDGHFIIPELDAFPGEISVIPTSEEKYISFTKYLPFKKAVRGVLKLRFLDTLRFLPCSLSKLAESLPKDSLKETRKQFPVDEQFDLLTRKGVFPYDHVTSLSTLDEPQLPEKVQFYSRLSLEHISDSDYAHAQRVWRTFNIRDLGQYSDLYMLTDVLLLTDIFENFRETSLRTHKLDPAHYLTLPSFSWECMLKHTGVVLETLQDHDMYLFYEKSIRGGISQVCKRRSVANNKHCEGYDQSSPSKYITYLDANNLYGWSMSQNLPTGGFSWLSREEIENLDVVNVPDDSEVGYSLEVDLEYPPSLHDAHRDLPFLCERKAPPGGKMPKLLTTLEDKTNYILHYRSLKQSLQHGLKLTKIHRVIRFNQSPWLKSYIELNTDLRKQAKNDFEKDLFKYFNNSIFGKTMESYRKRMDFRIVSDARKLEKCIAKPNYLHSTIFTDSMAGCHFSKTNIVLEKPIYVGSSILDLSKELMYSFYYDVLVRHFGAENVKLLYMDTDSFVLEIFTEDLYESFRSLMEHLDTSGLPRDNPSYSPINAKVIGKMKDEMNAVKVFQSLVFIQINCDPVSASLGVRVSVDYKRC